MKSNNYNINIFHYPKTIVGECVEYPIIVEAKTEQELKEKMKKGVESYLKVFSLREKR